MIRAIIEYSVVTVSVGVIYVGLVLVMIEVVKWVSKKQ